MGNRDEIVTEIRVHADRLAARLAQDQDGYASGAADAELRALLDAIRTLDARFAFDLEGRPAAIAAVREALPLMERELFDAVLEDFACQLAATEEAIYQLARASARRE